MFIKQGKTNYIYLLIIFVATIVIGSSVWWYSMQQQNNITQTELSFANSGNKNTTTSSDLGHSKAQENNTDKLIQFDINQSWISIANFFGSTESNNQQKCAISPQQDIYCVLGQSLLKSKDGGKTWGEEKFTSEEDIASWSSSVLNPTIIVDFKDRIHIVWTRALEFLDKKTSLQYYELRYRMKERDLWSEEIVINSTKSVGDGIHYYNNHPRASLALDSQNNIHVVWSQSDRYQKIDEYYPFTLHYRSKVDEVWQKEEIIDQWNAESDTIDSAPAIAVDSHNNIHVVWDSMAEKDYKKSYIFYREKSQSGWSAKEQINKESSISTLYKGEIPSINFSQDPDIAIDSNDNIYVVWEQEFSSGEHGDVGGSLIVLRKKTSSGWLSIESVGGSNKKSINNNQFSPQWGKYPSISIDYSDIVHVVWQDVDCGVWGTSESCELISYRKKDNYGWSDIWAYTPLYERHFDFFPNLIWARWPEVNGKPINVLHGYAFIVELPKTFPNSQTYQIPNTFSDEQKSKFNAFIIDDPKINRGIFGF